MTSMADLITVVTAALDEAGTDESLEVLGLDPSDDGSELAVSLRSDGDDREDTHEACIYVELRGHRVSAVRWWLGCEEVRADDLDTDFIDEVEQAASSIRNALCEYRLVLAA